MIKLEQVFIEIKPMKIESFKLKLNVYIIY